MRARLFAHFAHKGQPRKYNLGPYIAHPHAVANLVRSVPHTPEMIATAWLHDVVEDCGVTGAMIWNEFGSEVSLMVMQLSDLQDPSAGNRAFRKEQTRIALSHAHPNTKTIKLADLIDNTSSIVEHDPKFARVYLEEKAALLEVLTEGDATLWARAVDTLTAGKNKLESLKGARAL